MKRQADYHLQQWKIDLNRKPLILRGARQVGKTFAVRTLAKQFPNYVELNFEKTKEAHAIFKKNLDPHRIITEIKVLFRQPIVPGETLLFFDEIQECPDAITTLRYFFELMPELHVIAAGSLLDFAIEKVGIPVGRVSSFYMFPLSFMEFLSAMGYQLAAQAILHQPPGEPMPESIHALLLELLGQYLAIGGLPETVFQWSKTKDLIECHKILHRIADTYRQDFDKYAKKHQIKYLDVLFNQIPHFVGEQFKYSRIHGDYQKRELAPCLELLIRANVIHKVHYTAAHGSPLGAETNLEWFKLLFLDVALCQTILGADLGTWLLDKTQAYVKQGNIIEAFVGQELLCYSMSYAKSTLYFWKRDKRGSQAELDYLYPCEGKILPLEAKAKDRTALKSMHLFLQEHPEIPHGIRFSLLNYSRFDRIDSRPLYAVCSLAHPEQKQSLEALCRD